MSALEVRSGAGARHEYETCGVFLDDREVARLVAFCLVLLQGQVNAGVRKEDRCAPS